MRVGELVPRHPAAARRHPAEQGPANTSEWRGRSPASLLNRMACPAGMQPEQWVGFLPSRHVQC